jgi:Mg-chelatase subunit ChlD/anti-sigma factor RsiW
MNPENFKTPREEMESWLTSYLLGELSEGEAAAVRELIAHDAEFAKLHDRLKAAIVLVREAAPAEAPPAETLKLAEDRRQRLLASFKIPPLKKSDVKLKSPQRRLALVELLVVVAILGLIAAISVPSFNLMARRERANIPVATTSSNFYSLNVVGYVNVDLEDAKKRDLTPLIPPSKQSTTFTLSAGSEAVNYDSSLPVPVTASPPPPAIAAPVESLNQNKLGHYSAIELKGTDHAIPAPSTSRTSIVLPSESDADGSALADKNSRALFEDAPAKPGLNVAFQTTPSATSGKTWNGGGGGGGGQVGRGVTQTDVVESGVTATDMVRRELSGRDNGESARGRVELRRIDALAEAPVDPSTGLPVAVPSLEAPKLSPAEIAVKEAAQRQVDYAGKPSTKESEVLEESLERKKDVASNWSISPSSRGFYSDGVDGYSAVAASKPTGKDSKLEKSLDQTKKVPVLGDLPMIGQAFRAERKPSDPTGTTTLSTSGAASDYFNSGTLNLNKTTHEGLGQTVLADDAAAGLVISTNAIVANGTLAWGDASTVQFGANQLAGSNQYGDALTAKTGAGVLSVGGVDQTRGLGRDNWYAGDNAITLGGEATPQGQIADGRYAPGQRPTSSNIVLPADSFGTFSGIYSEPEFKLSSDSRKPADVELAARTPSQEGRNDAATHVRNGQLYFEMGKLDDAERELRDAQRIEPQNRGAAHFLNLTKGAREKETAGRQYSSRGTLVKTEAEWTPPAKREGKDILDAKKIAKGESVSPESGASKSEAYFKAKRELDELKGFNRVLQMKLSSEKVDQALPRTTVVELIERAQPAKEKTGFWRSFGAPMGGSYASSTRVRVERDLTDIDGLAGSRSSGAYDPYFVQTEFETMKSDAVLGKAVDALELDKAWAKKGTGEKLKREEAIKLLKGKIDLRSVPNTSLVEIRSKSDNADESAKIANAVADAYKDHRQRERNSLMLSGIYALEARDTEQQEKIQLAQRKVDQLRQELAISDVDAGAQPATNINVLEDAPPARTPSTNAPIPQPEIQTCDNAFSTFSLNVSDVSFKLAAASLEKGQLPDQASIRSEEFINAFDYRDPEAPAGSPIAFAWERTRYPFAHNRDLLRFSLKTAAAGRQAGRPLNIVLLLDNSGSMERADRVQIIREALLVLASQLQPQDKLSVITFARTARLVADGISGDKAGEVAEQVSGLTPQGGTNLEEAMNLAYQTGLRNYLANGINRIVLLTDGAANLGNVDPDSLKQKVEAHRKQGIALDCFGIGWEGYNDDLLEVLSRNGDGRYGFINSPEEAATEFAGQLAGALKVAASDVKVQVEFNPKRATAYRQIGYAKHQLTKEQFRDNTVDAAEIAAQEAGNALYTVEVNPAGGGPLCTVRVRYKIPGTTDYREQAWDVPYTGNAIALEQATPAMRLAASSSAFSEWLVASPYAGEVTLDRVLGYLSGVPEVYGADTRPKKLEWMIRQAKSLEGK